jgi:hypothetical protein
MLVRSGDTRNSTENQTQDLPNSVMLSVEKSYKNRGDEKEK